MLLEMSWFALILKIEYGQFKYYKIKNEMEIITKVKLEAAILIFQSIVNLLFFHTTDDKKT